MPKKGYTPKQIINKLSEAEILLNERASIAVMTNKYWGQRRYLLPMEKRVW